MILFLSASEFVFASNVDRSMILFTYWVQSVPVWALRFVLTLLSLRFAFCLCQAHVS